MHKTPLDLHPATRCIHGGQRPDPSTGAVMPPIYLTSTYAQSSPGVHQGYDYSRGTNPSRFAFERCIALMEGSTITESEDTTNGGFAFSSGLASIAATLDLLDSGDHVIAMDDLYGGTGRLFRRIRERSAGLTFSFVDLSDVANLEAAITDRTRLIWVESPTNPLLKLVDLSAIATIAKQRNILSACDNTFATPILQRPLELGFDISMHSVTKYLGGHSDVVGGALITRNAELAERIRFIQFAGGSILGPFDSYLALRGMKTLAIRMQQHCRSAQRIAEWLSQHAKVERVVYPGLTSHPQHALAQTQMQMDGKPAGGGMITIFLKGGLDASRAMLERVRIFALAESLGGVESLIEHPAIMTHASVPPDRRAALGISDGLVRLSVGIEHTDDLIADLEAALR
ncbi:MAG: trans-sulfuration enzyme family protein [Phycisphaerales bacterium]